MCILKRSLIWLLIAFTAYAAASAFFAWQLTSPARRLAGEVPADFPTTETVTFPARDGIALTGWFVPCNNAAVAVVLLHGNGGSRRQLMARVRLFHDAGFAVLLYDARGHGLSEGDKVSAGFLETADLLGAFDFLSTKKFHEFGCLGASQGGATILLAAEKLPPSVHWAIIESTYPTIRDALDRRFRKDLHLPGWLGGALLMPFAELRLGVDIDDIAPIKHIKNLRCPVFILGGTNDQHTLRQSTQALFDAAQSPKELWLVPGAAHVDLYGYAQQEYAKRILAFVKNVQPTSRAK
jgi:pimeloyl-ACP methyl ester carboxylesterase